MTLMPFAASICIPGEAAPTVRRMSSPSSMHTIRRGDGPTLLLVHGMGSSSDNWATILDLLTPHRSVIAVDLPGFGKTPPLNGPVTIATLTDALEAFIDDQGLAGVDTVGSSMGARIVLELARRGVGGSTVALDPGGFWTPGQRWFFAVSVGASIKLIRLLRRAMPAIAGNAIGRTVLFNQFSAHPWSIPPHVARAEIRSFLAAKSLDEAFHALARGPLQAGAPAGATPGKVILGWGRQDRITLPSQANRAAELFPDATVHWFEKCGHFPHWDQPKQTADLILASTG